MISQFFIDRPVFASVLSIVITIAGTVAAWVLPVAQYPEITPPSVEIVATYPGANAETVSLSVAAPIEQELSGAKDLLYFQSQSGNDGSLRIRCTFEIGADIDLAAVEVQNRLKRAEPRLPQEVVRQGITINKSATNILAVIALISDDPKYDDLYLSNYATIYLLDPLKRVPGAGDVSVFGSKDYSMRVWLDPDRLAAKQLTVIDVAAAIREQNGLFAAGRIGAAPNASTVEFTLPIITRGRLDDPQEFEDIILRAEPDGSLLHLREVGRVELGSQSYDLFGRLNGKPTTFILVSLQPGANALSTITGVREQLEELKKSFPEGVQYDFPYDTTEFIEVSIVEVVKTFVEAVLLVAAVVFVFLGSWRATLVPLLAVPVAIIGTFAGMLALGFTINSLTLFGLVLAIGIVVDDAIVVVENVERIMHDEHLNPRDATVKAMQQVTGPVIAIVLVLSSVFLPVAFLGGLTGELYRQFAVTIAVSVAISGIVALTLSPALCRLLLKPNHEKAFLFRWFDAVVDRVTDSYTGVLKHVLRHAVVALVLFGVLIAATANLFATVPTAFIPEEDQGYFIVASMLPPGASLERTSQVLTEVENFLLDQPEVNKVVTLGGMDILAGMTASTSAGLMFVSLKDWSERHSPESHVSGVINRTFGHFAGLKEAVVIPFNPPAVPGLGTRAGFELQLQSRSSTDIRELAEVTNALLAEARLSPVLTGVSGVLDVGLPQIYVEVNRVRAKSLGLPIDDIFNSLQAYLGALYVNDFNKFGRVYRVQIQAEPQFRATPDDIGRVYVRSHRGEMVPLSGVLEIDYRSGPNVVSRFNSYPSVQVTGAPASGLSTGEAMAEIERIAGRVLPPGYGISWSGVSYQEVRAGNQAPYMLAFGLVMVFLVLAAQYERWSLPFAVLLAVPIGAFGAVAAVWLRGTELDIYFQIGLLTLVGLASKNAILIVEFASVLHERGAAPVAAAIEAARLRLRPIVMTSLAFILGVLPLAISRGAGAAGRHSIGTGVMGGMIAATFLAVLFVPLFFVLIQRITAIGRARSTVTVSVDSSGNS